MTNSRQHPWWIFDQFWCRCYDDEVAHDLSQLRTDLAVAHRHCWTLYRETSSALGDKKIVLLSFTNSLHVFFSFSFFFSLSVLCTTIGTQAASIDGFWPTWQPADLNSFTLGELEKTTGRPRTTQQDLESLNLSLNEAIDVAQNRPLWRTMSMFGTTHS